MNIPDFLYHNALNTLWVNPHADKNAIFKTNKLTALAGGLGTVYLPFGDIQLPNTGHRYMLIEFGDVPANLIGLTPMVYDWVPIRQVINDFQTLIVGFSQGRMLTLEGSYIQFTENNNILIAIDYKNNQKVISLNDDIYFRFYTNIFYTGNTPTSGEKIQTGTFIAATGNMSAYVTFTSRVAALTASNPLPPLIFKNGIYLFAGLPAYNTLVPNDVIDFIADPLLIAVNTFNVADMNGFKSSVDNSNKIIASVDNLDGNIYVDDTECFITGLTSNGIRVGSYFPRLAPSYIRMLTYKDWSISAAYVEARVDELEGFKDINQLLSAIQIHLFKRTNEQYKPNILDSNYIPDLMNLPTAYRKQALSGVNSTLPIWRAATLESCPYINWITMLPRDISINSLYGVYSRYGAITAVEHVCKLPGNDDWSLPRYVGILGGSLLTYGTDGIGVSFVNYSAEDHTNETYSNGKGYEVFYPGQDTPVPLDLIIEPNNTTPTTMLAAFGIFCYYSNNGVLTHAIKDVDYTLHNVNENTIITWSVPMCAHERYVRSAQNSVRFTSEFTMDDAVAGIDIYNEVEKAHDVGMGVLSIWLNDHYLIEGLDYIVYNSRAYLTSKNQYWTDPADITVIYAGLPHSSLTHVPQGLWGWVQYGGILNDNKYDLNLYRNKLFYIDGRAIAFSDLNEKELYVDETDTVPHLAPVDGTPYAVVDVVQFIPNEPLDIYAPTTATELAQDAAVSAYLSVLDPQPLKTGIITIPFKYELVSPFMNAIIAAVLAGNIQATSTTGYSDDQIHLLTAAYLDRLHYDPCLLQMDKNYVNISPRWDTTVNTINLAQYDFLQRVNQVMLFNQVEGLHLYVNVV